MKQGLTLLLQHNYPELKVYGYNRADTINASMEFDIDLYDQLINFGGVPGRSNALEIAKRLGLSDNIINSASALTSEDSQIKRHDCGFGCQKKCCFDATS